MSNYVKGMGEVLFRAKPINMNIYIEGYYVYHINRTPCPIGDCVTEEDEEHYIVCDSFSDWNMPRDMQIIRIDPDTLEYIGYKSNAQECLDRIYDELLEDTTIVDPVGGNQGREILTDRVIKRYKKRYKKR